MMKKHAGVRAIARPRLGLSAVAGVAGLALAHGAAQAADTTAPVQVAEVNASGETVNVTGERKKPESPKYTAPLLDTPQTITIIDSGTIRGQNLLTLREILSTAPGITFGAGEGGGGYGDSINLRGYAANSDITVDGVKDSAQYTRTDPFNLEQIELVNGANSVYGGSGSLGGSINIVSKTPHGNDTTTVVGGLGTDGYGRVTLDTDQKVTDQIAIRLNAMGHKQDVPGRDVENYSRWGIAPSIVFGLGSPTTVTLNYLHQEDDNIPQYGVPYYANAFNNGPVPGVDPSKYYGYANLDTQLIDVDQFTVKVDHEFNEWLSVRNLTRYQEVDQVSVVDPPQSGVWCIASGINIATGAACATPGQYTVGGPRGNRRDTKNTLLYNQTDFAAQFETGGLKHSLVFGFSIADEDYHLETGNVLRNPNGATPNPVLPNMSIANPNNIWTGPVNFVRTGISDGQQTTKAVYLFDTIELNDQWEINAGIRYDRVDGEFTAAALPANTTPGSGVGPWTSNEPALVQGAIFRNADDLVSYRAGIVYKPVSNASIYFAYGNTETPSQASVNGGCTALTCNVDPEKGEIYELGVKWNILDDRLSLSASIFQNDRTNYKVASNDPTLPDNTLDGSARVRGLTLSATGNITDELTIFANYTYLDTEVIQGISDFCLTQPLTNTACYGPTVPYVGNPLTNTPENSGSIWATYEIGSGFTIGYGVSYQGEYYLNNGVTVTGGVARNLLYTSEAYWLHSAMVNYEVTEDLGLQLNVKNVLDEEYYIRIRNNGWAVPGDTRSATLTATYTF
ncbi:putative TonB-dependent receptor BfrD [Alphaproteobacteria bacterium SO-S41]|nr:putative TonB-dependent receptor BfrD [Alphaproteobacteria bacterium SO-S41]